MRHFALLVSAFLIFAYILPAVSPARQAVPSPKHEFRSAWITTAWSLDWPSGSTPAAQQQSMLAIIDHLEARRLNAIIFQVSARGDAYYRSDRLPWAWNLSGTPGEDPGWDPLRFVIDEAHRRGMEVHAWFNVFAVAYGTDRDSPATAEIPNIRFTQPEWMEDGGWMNPGIPEARQWQVDNVMELVSNYDIDAVHFDRIRYNRGGYDRDPDLMAQHNPDDITGLDNWRRHNVSEFVRMVHEGIRQIDPAVKIGAAPSGHYNTESADGWAAQYGYSDVFQDSRYWAEQGWSDYLAPQVYWDIGTVEPPRFGYIVEDWVTNRRNNRYLYIGHGPYKSEILAELPDQIGITRTAGAEGQAFYRYQYIAGYDFSPAYPHRALVPPMPWRDMQAPGAVQNLSATRSGEDVLLTWDPPPASGQDASTASGQDASTASGQNAGAGRFVIYRIGETGVADPAAVLDDPSHIVALTGMNSYLDETAGSLSKLSVAFSGHAERMQEQQAASNKLAGTSYSHAETTDEPQATWFVTALSRNNVEGPAASVEIGDPAGSGTASGLPHELALAQNYPNPFNPSTVISYALPEPSHVHLAIHDMVGRTVSVLVDKVQSPGRHDVTWDASQLASGIYIYRLKSAGETHTRRMTLIK